MQRCIPIPFNAAPYRASLLEAVSVAHMQLQVVETTSR